MIVLRSKSFSYLKEGITLASILSPIVGAGAGDFISKKDNKGAEKYINKKLEDIEKYKKEVDRDLDRSSLGEETTYDKHDLIEQKKFLDEEEKRLRKLSSKGKMEEYNNHMTTKGLQIGAGLGVTGGLSVLLRNKLKK